MTPENDKSMFGRVTKHDEQLEKHDNILDDHTIQLKIQAEQIKQLQDNGLRLENVVMSENRETRRTITESNKQLHDLVNNVLEYKSGQTRLSTNLKMAKMESIAKIIGILAGSGGLLWYIFGQ